MLENGDHIPELELEDPDGNPVRLQDLHKDKVLVLFFYPKDDSFGCTKEACGFRDQYEIFRDHGAEVVGVSSDDGTSHKGFRQKHNIPYPLLCDEDGKAREAFGVSSTFGLIPGRVTFVIGKDGTVLNVFRSQFRFGKHIKKALEAVKEEVQ